MYKVKSSADSQKGCEQRGVRIISRGARGETKSGKGERGRILKVNPVQVQILIDH